MNTHEHLSIEVLADYAEGLLGDADSTSVAEHLASCADCQAEAELLASVTEILAADDPGPMPDHYAARIDAALAELATAEPVTPKRTPAAAGAGAAVIDLASRRRFTPAARVGSVAASLVLVIGGVALGMQAINNGSAPDTGALTEVTPTPSSDSASPADRAALYAQKAANKPTGSKAKKGKNGAIIDKTDGTVFLQSGKVLFPDGTVVVPTKNGDAEVRVTDYRSGQVTRTIVPRSTAQRPTQTPKAAVTTPTVENTPNNTPRPTPTPKPSATATPSNAYVTNSGDTYTEDNFAPKVQALLRKAGETSDAVSGQPSDNGSTTPSTQNRVSSGAVRSDDTAEPSRGPAPADVAAKVNRCADQLKLGPLVAGDAGIWKGQSATILVTRDADAKQATGYVVYGNCTKDDPANAKTDVAWFQPVDVPSAAEPTPEPSPEPTSTSNPAPNPDTTSNSSVPSSVNTSLPNTAVPSLSTSTEP
jgi:hypothetical protein